MNKEVFFNLGSVPVYLGDFLWLLGILVLFGLGILGFNRLLLPFLQKKIGIKERKILKGKMLFLLLAFFVYLDISFWLLDIEILIFNKVQATLFIEAAIILVVTYILLWVASSLVMFRYSKSRKGTKISEGTKEYDIEKKAIRTIKWLLLTLAVLVLMRYIDWDYTFWRFESPKEGEADILFRISSILTTVIIFLVARLFVWVLNQILLFGYYKRKGFDQGIQYSISKLLSYIVFFVATILALRNLGMEIGLLLGGAAALLVGVGLALQNTFADFFGGLVLLFERPVKVGDYVTFHNNAVKVQKIGLRASIVKDRDSVNYIIPNSKLITQPVINWSHDEKSVRFQVNVGVAYGTDTKLVESILLAAADEHDEVLKRPKPKVLFKDFADSALQFELNYYSSNIFNAEWIKSDLRFEIDQKFRDNNVKIPFPQRDIWMRKED